MKSVSQESPKAGPVLLRRPEVERKIGFGRTTLYGLIKKGVFPPPKNVPGSGISLWLESEVDAWIESLQSKSVTVDSEADETFFDPAIPEPREAQKLDAAEAQRGKRERRSPKRTVETA